MRVVCAGTSTGNASGTSTSAIPRSLRIRSAHNPGHATERYLFAYALRVIYFNTITKSQLTIIPFIRRNPIDGYRKPGNAIDRKEATALVRSQRAAKCRGRGFAGLRWKRYIQDDSLPSRSASALPRLVNSWWLNRASRSDYQVRTSLEHRGFHSPSRVIPSSPITAMRPLVFRASRVSRLFPRRVASVRR